MKRNPKREQELLQYIAGVNEKLRRHYNMSNKKCKVFWDRVWEQLLGDPDAVTETIVEKEIGVLRDRHNNRKPEST